MAPRWVWKCRSPRKSMSFLDAFLMQMPYISWQLNSSNDCASAAVKFLTQIAWWLTINSRTNVIIILRNALMANLWYWMQLADVMEFVGEFTKVHESSNCNWTHCTCMSTSEMTLNCTANCMLSAHIQLLSSPSSCISVPVNTTTMCHMHFISHSAKLSRQLNMTKFPIFGKNESHITQSRWHKTHHIKFAQKLYFSFQFSGLTNFSAFWCLRSYKNFTQRCEHDKSSSAHGRRQKRIFAHKKS